MLFLMPHSGRHFLRFGRDLMPKSSILGAPWRPAGPKMVPRNAPNVILEAGRFQERLEGGTKTRFIDAFWHHLGDFGRHFGPSWAPRGSQNRVLGRQGVPKVAKIASKKRPKEKLDFLIEF